MPWSNLSLVLSSDALLGCLFLLAISLASLKLLPVQLVSERNRTPLDVATALNAYKSYEKASKSSARKMRTAFHAGLRTAKSTKRTADRIGYAGKLERLERAIEANAVVSAGIYGLATTIGNSDIKGSGMWTGSVVGDAYVGAEDHAKVREALKHFVRDWSDEGRPERTLTFGLVLDALNKFESEVNRRREKRVLVPGAGLGRLAWEISQLGLFPPSLLIFSAHISLH